MPEWTKDWTVYEAATILLAKSQYQYELPYDRCPADMRLSEVWEGLSSDCRVVLICAHEEF